MPEDCREQLREWAEKLATKEAEKTPEGQQVKKLELYRDSAINTIFETGATRRSTKNFRGYI